MWFSGQEIREGCGSAGQEIREGCGSAGQEVKEGCEQEVNDEQ